jgi:hypothetical protein
MTDVGAKRTFVGIDKGRGPTRVVVRSDFAAKRALGVVPKLGAPCAKSHISDDRFLRKKSEP